MYRLYVSASRLLSVDDWPDWIPARDNLATLLDQVYVVEQSLNGATASLNAFFRVLVQGEVELTIPGLAGAVVAIGVPELEPPAPDDTGEEPDAGADEAELADYDYEDTIPTGWTEIAFSIEIATDGFVVRLIDLTIQLRVDASLLHPPDSEQPATVTLRGDVVLDSVGPSVSFEGFDSFSLDRCEIGDTGIVLSAGDVTFLDSLSTVQLGSAEIEVPIGTKNDDGTETGENLTIALTNASFGTGGVSGTFATDDLGVRASLFGFDFAIGGASIDVRQNALVEARLSGTLTLPFFKDDAGNALTLRIDASLGQGGDWSVALSEQQDGHGVDDGIVTCALGAVGSLAIASLTLGSADGAGFVTIAGDLALSPQAGVELPTVGLTGLTVGTDGRIALEGGRLDLPEPQRVDLLGLLTIEITRIGFGQDGAALWVSLDGGIELPAPLPVASSVDGLRVSWIPGSTTVALSLEGVGVSFTIPDVISFSGYLALDFAHAQVAGSVDLALLPLGLSLGGKFAIGQDGGVHYVFVGIDADVPVGIPLGPGVGLYGLSGMFAYHLQANPDGEDWLVWYDGINTAVDPLDGWSPKEGAFGLGAGATLGTLVDNGFTLAVRAGFALLLPGPVLILEGKGNVLKERQALVTGDPLFTAGAVFDGPSGELSLSLSALYEIPALLDTQGTAAAFFDLDDASYWYVHLGEADEERRLRADLLGGLLHGDAYLMIDPDSVALGASIGWGDSWSFGPVDVTLEAWLAAAGAVSRSPQHYDASIDLGGIFSVSAGPLDLGLSIEASADAQAPHDEELVIDVHASVKLPWPLPDIQVTATLSWASISVPDPVSPIVPSIQLFEYGADTGITLATSEASAPMVGLDACFAIAFSRPVSDDAGAGNLVPSVASGIDHAGDYSFQYQLEQLLLERWNPDTAGWDGLIALDGSWQDTGGTRLWLGPRTPFAGTEWLLEGGDGARSATSYLGSLLADPWFPFGSPVDTTPTCLDFLAHPVGETLGPRWHEGDVRFAVSRTIQIGSWDGQPAIALADVTVTVDFGGVGSGSVGGLSLATAGFGGALVEATFGDGSTNSVDLAVGGAVPAWRDVVSLAITGGLPPGGISFLLGVCWVDEQTLDDDDLRDRAIELASTQDWELSLLTPGLYRLTVDAAVYRDGLELGRETPIGYFQCQDPPDDLAPYIESTVPAAGARPVFRKYDLVFEFRETYVVELYGGALRGIVVDEDGTPAPAESAPSDATPFTWTDDGAKDVGLVAWRSHLVAMPVPVSTPPHIDGADVLRVSLEDVRLEPGRRYAARLTTGDDSLYEVPFAASKFTDFADLVASFDGTVWDQAINWADDSARDAALAALAALASDAQGGAYDASGAQFDHAYVTLFGLPSRPWPDRLEVRALHYGNPCYGLVLDLPEAVELARLAVDVTPPAGKPVVIPSPDGSRILILLLHAGAIRHAQNGDYQVDLRFHRKVRGGALPTLSRGGSSDDEVASFTFALER